MTRTLKTLALVAALLPLTACSGGGEDNEIIKGIFRDASPLETGSEVRADGVLVGKVDSIKLNRARGVAVVGLEVQSKVLPVHTDAKMIIKPINLLGETYIELDPGTPSQPYLNSNLVGINSTESAVTLQGVLDTFDNPTSAGLAALLLTTGEGLEGNGENTADVIKALAPAMQDIERLGNILEEQNNVLASLIDKADPVSRALTENNGEDLNRTIASLRDTLEATRDKQDALGKTIDELPGTLKEARKTFASLETVSDELGPTLKKARPVTKDLREISDEIIDFSKDADPAFNGFDDLFENADKLLKEAAPVAKSLHHDGENLKDITHTVDQTSDELLDEHRRELFHFVRYWALSTNGRDATSHYFRGVFHVTPATMQMLLGIENPLLNIGELDQTAALDPVIGAADGLVKGLVGGGSTDSSSTSTDKTGDKAGDSKSSTKPTEEATTTPEDEGADGATGLTPKQEQGLLGKLLGGLTK